MGISDLVIVAIIQYSFWLLIIAIFITKFYKQIQTLLDS